MSWEADILRKLRIERKLTQAQFAEWLEIPLVTYNQWERGIRVPPLYVVKLIQYKCNHSTNGVAQFIGQERVYKVELSEEQSRLHLTRFFLTEYERSDLIRTVEKKYPGVHITTRDFIEI